MTASVEIRFGRVSARMRSPNREVAELIKAAVPASGRSYDGFAREWVVASGRVPALMAALRVAGLEVVEVGGAS